jgi:formamidopyrimidine-DNA glycosylase
MAMPELPEVEIMARNLERWLSGQMIESVDVLDAKMAGLGLTNMVGATVTGASRRAKYAVVDLSNGSSLVLHYRMTGKTVLDPERCRRARVRFQTHDGVVVAFEDQRRFGELWLLPTGDLDAFFGAKGIGPEPWPEHRDGRWWSAQLQGLRGPIKPALMRQDRVAGIGNIIASEALFLSKVGPQVLVPALTDAEWDRIALGVRTVIDRTLDVESGDEIAYVNLGGEGSFLVYGHAGEPCPRCQAPIERFVQSGRGTFYCSVCVS